MLHELVQQPWPAVINTNAKIAFSLWIKSHPWLLSGNCASGDSETPACSAERSGRLHWATRDLVTALRSKNTVASVWYVLWWVRLGRHSEFYNETSQGERVHWKFSVSKRLREHIVFWALGASISCFLHPKCLANLFLFVTLPQYVLKDRRNKTTGGKGVSFMKTLISQIS